MGAGASVEGGPPTPERLSEHLDGRRLSEHEWSRLVDGILDSDDEALREGLIAGAEPEP